MCVVVNQDKCKCFICRSGVKCDHALLKEAKAQLADERAKVALAVEALKGLLVMTDRGPCPRKLDDALTWRANDDLARSKALTAIETGEQSTDALADIRRAVARECAEYVDDAEILLPIEDWLGTKEQFGKKLAQAIASAIRAKFGVTE